MFKLSLSFGIGNLLAIIISMSKGNSFLWVIFHGFLGWFYVFYSAFAYLIPG